MPLIKNPVSTPYAGITQIRSKGYLSALTAPLNRYICITLPFVQFLRQAQILILGISNIFLWLKFSPSLNLNKIEHSAKVSNLYLLFILSTLILLDNQVKISVIPKTFFVFSEVFSSTSSIGKPFISATLSAVYTTFAGSFLSPLFG